MNSNSSHRLVARRSDFERPTTSRGKALLVRNRFCGSGSSNEIEKSGTFEVRVQLEKRKPRKSWFFPDFEASWFESKSREPKKIIELRNCHQLAFIDGESLIIKPS